MISISRKIFSLHIADLHTNQTSLVLQNGTGLLCILLERRNQYNVWWQRKKTEVRVPRNFGLRPATNVLLPTVGSITTKNYTPWNRNLQHGVRIPPVCCYVPCEVPCTLTIFTHTRALTSGTWVKFYIQQNKIGAREIQLNLTIHSRTRL